jgi:hypothetical protein
MTFSPRHLYRGKYQGQDRATASRKGWLFRAVDRRRKLTNRRLSETDVYRMIKRRADARRRARQHVLSHVPGDRDHGLAAE